MINGHLEPADLRESEVPESLGRYEISRPMGRGAHARIFRAFDPILGRDVEIRAFGALGDNRQRRFLRDLHSISALEHDGLARIYDAGVNEGALAGPYLVTEYVDAPSLADVSLSLKDGVRALATAARACHAAHKLGIQHRDLRPANVLVGPRTLVLGMGVVHLLGDAEGRSPEYSSPEQLTGREAIGPWTDVYALGAMLYEQLTGFPPVEDGSDGESEVRAPSTGSPKLPDELVRIAMRALNTFPEERHRSAESFADDLDAWLSDAPRSALLAVAWIASLLILAAVLIALFAILGSGP
jgi:eukaryotic-like serine/threonine-protein kinase